MFKKILLVTAITAVATAAQASPSKSYYFKAFGGFGSTTHKGTDNDADISPATTVKGSGLAYGASFGKKFNDYLRADLEYYGNQGMDGKKTISGIQTKVKAPVNAAFINAGLEISNKSLFTPYVFGGVGMAMVSPNINAAGSKIKMDSKMLKAYQGGVGIMLAATNNVALDIGVRHVAYSSTKIKAKSSDDQISFSKKADNIGTLGFVVSF